MRIAKTFYEILKFNPYHDRLGRFTFSNGFSSFSANPKTKAGIAAIRRAQKENPLIGAAYGTKHSKGQIEAEKKNRLSGKKAAEIISDFGIEEGKRAAISSIKNLYSEVDRNGGIRIDGEKIKIKKEVSQKVNDTAKEILENAEFTDSSTATEYKQLRNYIRSTPVKISDQDKSNITDYGDYLKENFGGTIVSNRGIALDSFYSELSTQFPHYFNSSKETNPGDQLKQINSVLNSLKPTSRKLSTEEMEVAQKEMLQLQENYQDFQETFQKF